MPEYAVPAILQVKGILLVEAKSRPDALRKAENQEWTDCDVNTPIDIIDGECDCGDADEIERND